MRSARLARTLFLLSSLATVFTIGVAVGRFQIFPFPAMRLAKDSVVAVFKERNTIAGVRPDHFLEKARYDGNGVTRRDETRMAPGLTFLQGFFDGGTEMRLIRADGSIIRRWPVRFYSVVKDSSHIRTDYFVPKTDWNIELHGSAVLRDGSVVFNFERGGLVKVDRCGNTQWVLHRMTHHSVEPSADGGFWVPGSRFRDPTEPSPFALLKTPFFEDTIIKVSDEGKVLTEVSLPGLLFTNSLHASILFANGMPYLELGKSPNRVHEEITHLNDVEELPAEIADRFPQFAAGDLLLSERDYDLIMVIDPKTQRVKWRQQGPWLKQHDPDFQPNGRISIFSNNADGTAAGTMLHGSTILEVNPADGSVVRAFGGTPDQPMYTLDRGKHQRLTNGNILVTESTSGRVIEVDARGDVVWEYINRYDKDFVAVVTEATRYGPDYFTVRDWSCP